MKKLFITTVLALGVLGTASANFSVPGVSSTDLNVRIDNGAATIFGSVDSGAEEALARNYVEGLDGVDNVIDLITHN